MKDKLLFAFAFITHPVLIPVYCYFLFHSHPSFWDVLILLSIALIVPVFILRMKKVNLHSPSKHERIFSYALFALCYVITGLLIGPAKLFNVYAIANILLALVTYFDKWSWHATAWGLAYFPVIGSLFSEPYGPSHEVIRNTIIIVVTLGLAVMIVRYLQKAHTIGELIFGYLLGGAVPLLYLLCMS